MYYAYSKDKHVNFDLVTSNNYSKLIKDSDKHKGIFGELADKIGILKKVRWRNKKSATFSVAR